MNFNKTIIKFLLPVFMLIPGAKAVCQFDRPNIIFILIDDLRYDALGVTGHPFFESPVIDRIANEGIHFKNNFAVSSICSPSRATALTGLYPHSHGVYTNGPPLNYNQYTTFPEILRNSGYETAFMGKFHVGSNGRPKPGFDRWVGLRFGQYIDPVLNIDGQDTLIEGHLTEILTDYALEFIDQEHQEPFFLMLSHRAVHHPLIPQDQYQNLYDSVDVPLPVTWGEDLSNKPDYLRYYLFNENEDSLKSYIEKYYEVLAGVEESVADIITLLEQNGILDQTLILFTGDNGLLIGEHNLLNKVLAYEESVKIPLFVRYPEWFGPGTLISSGIALNIDLAPTFLDAANIEIPSEMQGVSLRELAVNPLQRQNFLYEFAGDVFTPPIRSVRTLNYKYITYPTTFQMEELYDLTLDSLEVQNLIYNVGYSEILAALQLELDSLRQVTDDPSVDVKIFASDVTAYPSDTILVDINLELFTNFAFSSFTVTFKGFQGLLDYLGIDCSSPNDSCLYQQMDNVNIVTEDTDVLLSISAEGSNDVTGEGKLMSLKFAVPQFADGEIPVTIQYAEFNDGQIPINIPGLKVDAKGIVYILGGSPGLPVVKNGGFETWTDFTPDYWERKEVAGNIFQTSDSSEIYSGNHAVGIIRNDLGSAWITQTIIGNLKGDTQYTLSFYTRGDGNVDGRYSIGEFYEHQWHDILFDTLTGVSGTIYEKTEYTFITHPLIKRLHIDFIAPAENGTAFFDDVYLLTPDILVVLSPNDLPINIGPDGGSFDFNVKVQNNTDVVRNFHGWIMAQLPDSTDYGPVFGPVNVELEGSETADVDLTQIVPGVAPEGRYLYKAITGIFPDSIIDSDRFYFNKIPAKRIRIGRDVDRMSSGWSIYYKDTDVLVSNGDEWTVDYIRVADGSFLNTDGKEDQFNLAPVGSFGLYDGYPNPFNPITNLGYDIPVESYVKITIMNIVGQEIKTLINRNHLSGSYTTIWDGTDNSGAVLSSGIYFIQIIADPVNRKFRAEQFIDTKKLIYLK